MTDTRIPLRGRHGEVRGHALIDAEDAAALLPHKWHLTTTGYARTWFKTTEGKWRPVMMHRLLLGLGPTREDTRQGDHINGDKLDNRRANLRIVTGAENRQNKRGWGKYSQHRGVTFNIANGKWMAYAQTGARKRTLGYFDSEDEAARVASEFRARHMPASRDARGERP